VTAEEKLDRLIRVVDSHDHRIESPDAQTEKILEGTENLLEAARLHDGQIGALIERTDALVAEMRQLEKQWQTYLTTLPRQ